MQSLTLLCKAGRLQVRYDGQNGIAEASIPHNVRIHKTAVPWRSILKSQPSLLREPEKGSQRALGSLSESSVGVDGGDSVCPLVSIVKGMSFILVELPQVEDLLNLKVGSLPIDHSAIKWDDGWSSFTTPYYYAVESQDPVNRTFKLRTRMIWEAGEDPATGSAACTLGAFLALQIAEGGKTYTFSVDQGVEMGRHSNIGVQVTLEENGRSIMDVRLSGSAVLVSKGTLKSR